MANIKTITLPSGTTYDIVDQGARTELATKAPINSPALTGTPTAPTATAGTNTTQIATTAFVKNAVDTAVTGGVAYQGAVNSNTDISGLGSWTAGWYWVIATAGTYVGQQCEVGDMIFCNTTSTTYAASNFNVVQTNIDPDVYAKTADLGDLAYKDSASGSYTPAGSVTVGTSASKHPVSKASSGTATYTPEGSVTLNKTSTSVDVWGTTATSTSGATYTPEGSVSFTNTNKTATVSPASSGDATYTPEGGVSLTKTATSIDLTRGTGTSSNYTVKEAKTVTVGTTSTTPTVTLSEGTSTTGYQVKGTISTPTITVTPSTATVNSITDVGTLPTFSATVANENLTLAFTQGTLPTKGANQTVATGIQSASSTQPTFTGGYVKAASTAVTTPTGSSTITYDYTTLTDSVDIPTSATFTGTGARLVTGNISVPTSATFNGTGAAFATSAIDVADTATFSGTAVRLETDNITSPNGTNSFSGTAATITVD